jgi:membrane protease YdiL (CAAX protease family)
MTVIAFDLDWEQKFFMFAITATMLGYYGYYYLSHSVQSKSWFEKRFSGDHFWMRWILFQKTAGLVFMGLIPMIFYISFLNGSIADFGLSPNHLISNWHWLAGLTILLLVINNFTSRKHTIQQQYPQMRLKFWTGKRFLMSSLGWVLYLLAYEYLFRGLLLFSSFEAFGVWPAIAINVAIYSAVHMPKGAGETIGAIPFGVLSCMITLETGTFLIPVFAHVLLAVSMEFFTIKFNPDIHFAKIKR